MNGSLTMLAIAMASLGGVTPPEHIPPAPVPATAYQGLRCDDLMRAAETVDDDLARAWDRQEMLVRHRFGAPPPIVRRSEGQVAQLKGELEAIWRAADRKGCGEAPEQADLAWAPGREPGPMLGDPRDLDAFEPGPEADAAYGDEPAYAEPPEPVDQAILDDDLAGGPMAEEPPEVDGYGPSERDAGPARWPSAGEQGGPRVVAPGQRLDDADWPTADRD